eukprot:gene31350-12838_t
MADVHPPPPAPAAATGGDGDDGGHGAEGGAEPGAALPDRDEGKVYEIVDGESTM